MTWKELLQKILGEDLYEKLLEAKNFTPDQFSSFCEGLDDFHLRSIYEVLDNFHFSLEQIMPDLDIKYNSGQLDEIFYGLLQGCPDEILNLYADPKFSTDQMFEIRMGSHYKLSIDNIRLYADVKYTDKQMEQIRLGLQKKIAIDLVKKYAKETISSREMKEIRLALQKGMTFEDATKLAAEKLNAPQKMKPGIKITKTIDELKQCYIDKEFTLKPYTSNEVDKAIKEFGILPAILVEYYQKIGRIAGEDKFYYHIISPSEIYLFSQENIKELEMRDKGEYLVFAEEMVGVCQMSIKNSDLNTINPKVYGGGDGYSDVIPNKYWYTNTDNVSGKIILKSLSDFLWSIFEMNTLEK